MATASSGTATRRPPATRAKIGPVASLDSPLRSVISLISNKFKVISYLTHPTFIYSLSDQVNSADDKIALGLPILDLGILALSSLPSPSFGDGLEFKHI